MSIENNAPFAAHLQAAIGSHRLDGVGIWNLHVIIYQEDDAWIAQGLEIDHVAQGSSVGEAKQRFQDTFRATIKEHLRMFEGSIERFVFNNAAPEGVQLEMDLKAEEGQFHFDHISLHLEPLDKRAKIWFFAEVPDEDAA